MLTVVIARYQENIEWVNQLACNVVIVNKAQVGNTGREAASWLWFIATHYHSLQGDYVFAQGNPFEHCPDFIQTLGKRQHYGQRLTCDWNGAPHHPGLPLGELAGELRIVGGVGGGLQIEFTMGAQFQRSAKEIRCWHESEYHRALKLAQTHPQAPWVFERLWDYLIPTL